MTTATVDRCAPRTDVLEMIEKLKVPGATLQSVGTEYGITRERVRQLVRKHGFTVAEHRRLRHHYRVVKHARRQADRHARREARRAAKREAMLELLRTLAATLGHTPRIVDVVAQPGAPTIATYFNVFGSFREACRLAGLTPNASGWHGRVRR